MANPRLVHPFTEEREPAVYIHRYPAVVTDSVLEDYLATLNEWHAAVREPFVAVASTGNLTATQRRRISQSIAPHEKQLRTYAAGIAFIAPNPVIVGVVTALLWLAPSIAPTKVFDGLEPALDWARERLAQARFAHAPVVLPSSHYRVAITSEQLKGTPPGSKQSRG